MEGKFAVKRTLGCFNGVGADMALEQTFNRSQKVLLVSSEALLH